jgi:hypothetical protein
MGTGPRGIWLAIESPDDRVTPSGDARHLG